MYDHFRFNLILDLASHNSRGSVMAQRLEGPSMKYKDSPVPNYLTVDKDTLKALEDNAKYWHNEWEQTLIKLEVEQEIVEELKIEIKKITRANYWLDLFDRTITLNGYKTTIICTAITSPVVYYLVTR